MSAEIAGRSARAGLEAVLADAALLCRDERRADLERLIRLAASRLERSEAIVCLVGEYKKGKSTLVNALLGADVCPVDDDFATSALTIVSYAEARLARIHRAGPDGPIVEEIALDRLAEFASERENPANEKRVDLVEIGFPAEALAGGLAIVDTPGFGGFGRAYAAAILGFLPVVDGLLFVSDASAELSAEELSLFAKARLACPEIIVSLTKVDLYPSWRQIAALDTAHLAGISASASVIALAAPLRRRALVSSDEAMDRESGYPELLRQIRAVVMGRAAREVARRAVADTLRAVDHVAASITDELSALEHPAQAQDLTRRAEEIERRGRALREAGSRWSVTLADAFADLRIEMDQRLRDTMARRFQEVELEIAAIDPVAQWDGLVERLRARLAEDAYECFAAAYAGSRQIAERIGHTMSDDRDALTDMRVDDLVGGPAREGPARPGASRSDGGKVEWGLGMLRGAQGGGYTLAWATGILGLTVAAPVALGAGALFAAKFVLDERKRQTERRRQEARAALKQYVDGLSLELGRRMQHALNQLQRSLRDHYQIRLPELSAALAEEARAFRDGIGADEAARKAGLAKLRSRAERVAETQSALRGASSAL